MTVELLLLRHAHAGDKDAWEGPDDERPLTEKGRTASGRLGAFLRDTGTTVDTIVSSPKKRALETASIVAECLGVEVEVDEVLADGFGLSALDALLGARPARRPMLVGHDPDFSALVAVLCSSSRVPLKKGALARVDIDGPVRPGSGTLRWLLSPDLFTRGQDAVGLGQEAS